MGCTSGRIFKITLARLTFLHIFIGYRYFLNNLFISFHRDIYLFKMLSRSYIMLRLLIQHLIYVITLSLIFCLSFDLF